MAWLRRAVFAFVIAACVLGALPVKAFADTELIPLPVFATSRNEGNSYGAMPVWMLKDQSEYVYAIIAPSVIYNESTGVNFTFRYLGYPTLDKNYRIFVNQSTKVDQEFTAEYWDNKFLDGKFRLHAMATWNKDSLRRFFGLTELSEKDNETNYTGWQFAPQVSLGYYLPEHFIVFLGEKLEWMTMRRGKAKGLPFIQELFPKVDGVDGGAVLSTRLTLSYDTRDDEVFPTQGWYANAFGEYDQGFTHGRVFSKTGVNARTFISFPDDRFITVLKGEFEYTGGSHVPFFARSSLGGETTLRGFGNDRFVDDGYLLFNMEERIRLFKLHIFGVWSEWETAPFLDMGRVYSSFSKDFAKSWQFNPGIGFRAIVRPNVVGRVDFGFGKEGLSAFVGLDMPF